MGIRSGLGGQIGIAPESEYGTFVAPSKFIEGTAQLKDEPTYVVGGGIAAGRMQKLGARRRKTAVGASGQLEMEVTNKGMGVLLQALMGTTVVPVQQGASAAYLQTHTLGDPFGKFFTLQEGIPEVSTGIARPYSYVGCKVLSAEFKCAANDLLTSTWDIDAREMTEVPALAAASYPTTLSQFDWTQLTVKVGATVGAAAAVDGVKGVTVKFDRASDNERRYAGAGGKKAEPVLNDWQAITGTFDADFLDKATFADRFHSGAGFATILEWVGPSIGGGFSETFRITLPQCFLTGETPALDGPGVINGPFAFETQFDGSTQPMIELVSTDVTL